MNTSTISQQHNKRSTVDRKHCTPPHIALTPKCTGSYIAHCRLCCVSFRMLMKEGTNEFLNRLSLQVGALYRLPGGKSWCLGWRTWDGSANILCEPHRTDCSYVIWRGCCTSFPIDPSLSSALKCKRANQSKASTSSDQGLTTTRLCSTETHEIIPDFCLF